MISFLFSLFDGEWVGEEEVGVGEGVGVGLLLEKFKKEVTLQNSLKFPLKQSLPSGTKGQVILLFNNIITNVFPRQFSSENSTTILIIKKKKNRIKGRGIPSTNPSLSVGKVSEVVQ